MNQLIAFYDIHCDMCCACRKWILKEPAYLPIRFVAYQSNRARELFPDIDSFDPAGEIIVLADTGAVYRGGKGWIMCLYALRNYREWALRMAQPALLPLAKKLCHLVSKNRHSLSVLFRDRNLREIQQNLETVKTDLCTNGTCKTR